MANVVTLATPYGTTFDDPYMAAINSGWNPESGGAMPSSPLWTYTEVDYGNKGSNQETSREQSTDFDIPTDAYPQSKSRTGLPDWGLDISKGVSERLPGLLDNWDAGISTLAGWSAPNLEGSIDQWAQSAGSGYLKSLQPFENYMRDALNTLAGRGGFDSTLTRDAITNIGGLLGDDFKSFQTDVQTEALGQKTDAAKWAAEQERGNLGDVAKLQGVQAGVVGDIMALARTAEASEENKTAMYSVLLEALLA